MLMFSESLIPVWYLYFMSEYLTITSNEVHVQKNVERADAI